MPRETTITTTGTADLSVELLARIEASPLQTTLFDHIYLDGAFSPPWYRIWVFLAYGLRR